MTRILPLAGRALLIGLALWWGPGWAQPAAPPTLTVPVPELSLPPLPPGAPTVIPAGQVLSLDEAIAIALRRQPQLAAAQAQEQAAAARTRQATSGLLPSLGVSAQAATSGSRLSGAAGGTATSDTFSASISAQQLVFDFGRTRAQVAQARTLQRAAAQGVAGTRQEVISQVKQAYYLLLQNQRLVAVQQSNLDAQRSHLARAQARFEAGDAPRADVIRAETAVAEATTGLANAQNAEQTARVNLNITLDLDVRTPTRVQETEEPPLPTLDPASLVETALANRPEAIQALYQLTAAGQAVRVAATGNLPSLVVQADYGLRSSSFPPRDRNWSYGLGLQWPLFDSGYTRGRRQEAEAEVRSAQANLRQVQQTIASEVVRAYLDLQTAQQQVAVATVAVASAEENLRVALGRYQEGLGIYLDVIDAQAALLTAQTDRVNALYGVSAARAALKRALGQEEG